MARVETALIERIARHQFMVAVRTATPEEAYQAAIACAAGGIQFIEITFSVPDAEMVIKRLSAHRGVTIGAGTILTRPDARKAIKAGASYIVSPNCDEEIIRFAKREGLVSIPGACTPSEIYAAYRAGGDIIKLFPFVQMGGLSFLKDIRGPLPFVRYMLAGGVNLDNVNEYLAAKASCILIGSSIVRPELVQAGNWQAITELAKQFVQKANQALSPIRP